jgi:hypothetical protein
MFPEVAKYKAVAAEFVVASKSELPEKTKYVLADYLVVSYS